MGWLGNWAYRRKIVIPASKIDDTLNNFPLLIIFGPSDTDFHAEMTTSDWGKIACTTDDGVTQIKGVVNRSRSSPDNHWSGTVIVPQIDKNVDTILYFYYDSSQAFNTTYWGSAQHPTNSPAADVWNSNFIGVYQFGQAPSTGDELWDSTGNDNYGDAIGAVSRVDNEFGAAWNFDGSTGYAEVFDTSPFVGLSAITIEIRFKKDSEIDWMKLVDLRKSDLSNDVFRIYLDDDVTDRDFDCQMFNDSDAVMFTLHSNGGFNNDEWYTLQVTYDKNTNTARMYVNGEFRDEVTGTSEDLNSSTDNGLYFGRIPTGSGHFLDGQLFEVRFSDIARPVAWLKATHLSLSNELITIEEENSSESSFSQTSKSSSSESNSSSSESSGSSSSSSEDSKSQSSASDGWLPGYRYRVKLTIDNTKVDGDRTNQHAGIHISADSGPSSQDLTWLFDWLPNPRDWRRLAFTQGDGVSRLYADVERWTPEDNEAWIWVGDSTGAWTWFGSSDTEFYLYFDPLTSDETYISKGGGVGGDAYTSSLPYIFNIDEDAVENKFQYDSGYADSANDLQMFGEWMPEHFVEGPNGHRALVFNNGEGFRFLRGASNDFSQLKGATTGISIEMLIKFTATPPQLDTILDFSEIGSRGVARVVKVRYSSTNGIILIVFDSSNSEIDILNTAWFPSIGTWYYVALMYNPVGTQAVLQVNTTEQANDTSFGSGQLAGGGTGNTIYIGASASADASDQQNTRWSNVEIARIEFSSTSRGKAYRDTQYYQYIDDAITWGALEGDVSESPSSLSWSSSLSSSSNSSESSASSISSTSSSSSSLSVSKSSTSSLSESSSSQSVSKSSSSESSVSSESSTSSSSSSESSTSSSSESSESSRSKISDVAGIIGHIGGMGEQAFAANINPLGIQNHITAINTLVEPVLSQITAINELSGDPASAVIVATNEISDKDIAQGIVKNLITIGSYGAQFQSVDWNIFLDGVSIRNKINEESISVQFNEATVHNTINFSSIDRSLFLRCDTLINYGQPRLRLDISGRTFWFLLERRAGDEINFQIWGRSISALDDEPYATTVDFTLTQPTSAKEVAETIVQSNAVDFQVIDWVLPIDFEFSGTPVEGLLEIANAIGGVLRCKDDGSFLIRRKYPVRPVNIPNAAANVNYDRVANIIQLSFEDIKGSGWDRVEVIGYAPGAQIPVLELEESSPVRGTEVHLRVYWANNAPTEEVEEFVTDGLISDLGSYTEQKTETVVFTEGTADTQYPITSLDSFEFIGFDAGIITATQYTTELNLSSTDLYAIATVTYTTTYQRYMMFDHDVVKLLTVLSIPTASDTSIIVQMGEGLNPSPRNIEQGLLTNEAVAVERGLAFLDLNRYDRRRIVLSVPYSDSTQDGNIAYLNEDELSIVGNVHISAVEINFKGPQVTNRVEVELCLL